MVMWQDIETAPKDIWILAKGSQSVTAVAVRADEEDGWWEDETGDYWVQASANPNGPYGLTHWTPLPAPPSVEQPT